MKKKLLKFMGILILSIALVGFWGYNKYFKPDPAIEQALNDQFGEEFFTSFEEEGVNNTELVSNQEPGKLVGLEPIPVPVSNSPSLEEKGTDQEQSNTGTTPAKNDVTEKTVTEDEISGKYSSQFSHLQNVALGRLDTLYSTAIREYEEVRKAGTVNRSELLQKYIQAGKTLEASVDKQFYSALNAMEAELKANNLSTDIVGVYKNEYEKAKSSKRSQLLAKVMK
jgi:hypothetical protein